MVVVMEAKAMDRHYESNPLYRRRQRVNKTVMAAMKKLAREAGLELSATYETEYGSTRAYLEFTTLPGRIRTKAQKQRREEDEAIAELNRQIMRAYREACHRSRQR